MNMDKRHRVIRLWLHAIAALIFAMVLVGGATRLTESGLSIVEWKPVTGTLPPLGAAAWQAEFDKYKAIPQFQRNSRMTLDEFKTIFWWEWTHRLMGRVIGAAFLLPFLFFLAKGWIGPPLRGRLWAIFALGALQGAVGWWMVASGLAERFEVSQYRLATHLILACVIFVAVLWTALQLGGRPGIAAPPRVRAGAVALLTLALAQIYLGALVAGLRAGLLYNTWPLIDGRLVPETSRLFFETPFWRNLFENALTVQFNHRMTAYLLLSLALLHLLDVARSAPRALPLTAALAGAIALQAVLGIFTLLHQVPIALALAHQAGAIVVLALATVAVQRISVKTSSIPIGVSAPAR
jgi:cytochrome c oxidase assembly protein subunit 15